jgi:hypothetical protein
VRLGWCHERLAILVGGHILGRQWNDMLVIERGYTSRLGGEAGSEAAARANSARGVRIS